MGVNRATVFINNRGFSDAIYYYYFYGQLIHPHHEETHTKYTCIFSNDSAIYICSRFVRTTEPKQCETVV